MAVSLQVYRRVVCLPDRNEILRGTMGMVDNDPYSVQTVRIVLVYILFASYVEY